MRSKTRSRNTWAVETVVLSGVHGSRLASLYCNPDMLEALVMALTVFGSAITGCWHGKWHRIIHRPPVPSWHCVPAQMLFMLMMK